MSQNYSAIWTGDFVIPDDYSVIAANYSVFEGGYLLLKFINYSLIAPHNFIAETADYSVIVVDYSVN